MFSYSIWFQTTPRVNTMPQVSPYYFFFLSVVLQFLAICYCRFDKVCGTSIKSSDEM